MLLLFSRQNCLWCGCSVMTLVKIEAAMLCWVSCASSSTKTSKKPKDFFGLKAFDEDNPWQTSYSTKKVHLKWMSVLLLLFLFVSPIPIGFLRLWDRTGKIFVDISSFMWKLSQIVSSTFILWSSLLRLRFQSCGYYRTDEAGIFFFNAEGGKKGH